MHTTYVYIEELVVARMVYIYVRVNQHIYIEGLGAGAFKLSRESAITK
jgi:hypothetical protein